MRQKFTKNTPFPPTKIFWGGATKLYPLDSLPSATRPPYFRTWIHLRP